VAEAARSEAEEEGLTAEAVRAEVQRSRENLERIGGAARGAAGSEYGETECAGARDAVADRLWLP
jgi:hypothetical protein